jgi:hypothetical protein
MIYEFQEELETCLPDTSFWHFNGDFIIDYKPQVDSDELPAEYPNWDEMRETLTYIPAFMFHKDLNH